MNQIIRDPIDIENLRQKAHHPKAGAMILFCGDIRNHSEERSVVSLEYEAHESMALKQIDDIVAEANKKWGLHFAEVIHRFGKMNVLECSVAIAVSASHRKEAYIASKYIIDTIKHAVPIWKKEHFEDGSSDWSKGCEACGVHEFHETPEHHDSPEPVHW